MTKDYLQLMHKMNANLNAADRCAEEGDEDGWRILQEMGFEVWDEIANDIKAGVVINTDGWSTENLYMLDKIIERSKEGE